MKKLYTILTALLLTVTLWAQSPEKMSYQAVIRNNSDQLVSNQQVGMQISILQGSTDGTAVYVETQTITSNANGLVTLEIGTGTTSDDFSAIDWANSTYFIKTETDPTGGTTYSITGTSQLLSVPYALHAKTAETVTGEITITETDPIFTTWDKSTGISITESQISDLEHFTAADETDPVFGTSIAKGINETDTTNWNNKLDNYTETDPDFNTSLAAGITSSDITNWDNKLDNYTETDPLFNASVAKGINSVDTTSWNNKSEFDGDFSSLYNAPNMANTTFEKNIKLNTNDATSSVNITKNNGASVLKVDGTGRITGDGSGLSNVKPLLNYTGGDQRYQITANYGSYNNVRSVTMTAPSSGVCFVIASGYLDWESIGWDVFLSSILCDQDPNSSGAAVDEWYHYLNIVTDYNCPDSSDQYTSFSQHRSIPVSAGTHTFYLWANKYTAAAKTEVADVNISVMFFPTEGTGKSSKAAMIKEEEPVIVKERIPNTVAGYK